MGEEVDSRLLSISDNKSIVLIQYKIAPIFNDIHSSNSEEILSISTSFHQGALHILVSSRFILSPACEAEQFF